MWISSTSDSFTTRHRLKFQKTPRTPAVKCIWVYTSPWTKMFQWNIFRIRETSSCNRQSKMMISVSSSKIIMLIKICRKIWRQSKSAKTDWDRSAASSKSWAKAKARLVARIFQGRSDSSPEETTASQKALRECKNNSKFRQNTNKICRSRSYQLVLHVRPRRLPWSPSTTSTRRESKLATTTKRTSMMPESPSALLLLLSWMKRRENLAREALTKCWPVNRWRDSA